jgi:hypothetical protein
MAARLEVVKAVAGQRIYFNPQEGRPTATPSVQIKDENGNTITAAATTNVTQSTANTTVAVASVVGATTLTLTAVTGVEYRKSYLITNGLQQREWVRVVSVNSATKVVGVDEPLQFAHDTAATFQSTEFYRTLQAAEVADLKEMCRARASYAVGGLTYTQEINFDVVLTPLVDPLTVEFVKRRRPDIMPREFSQTRGSDLQDIREAAWDRVLKGIRSHGAGWRPALLRTPEDVEEWALAEFDLLAYEAGLSTIARKMEPIIAVQYLEDRVNRKRNHSLSTLKFMDFDENDFPSSDEVCFRRPDFRR